MKCFDLGWQLTCDSLLMIPPIVKRRRRRVKKMWMRKMAAQTLITRTTVKIPQIMVTLLNRMTKRSGFTILNAVDDDGLTSLPGNDRFQARSALRTSCFPLSRLYTLGIRAVPSNRRESYGRGDAKSGKNGEEEKEETFDRHGRP
jgi:hypothetical protein